MAQHIDAVRSVTGRDDITDNITGFNVLEKVQIFIINTSAGVLLKVNLPDSGKMVDYFDFLKNGICFHSSLSDIDYCRYYRLVLAEIKRVGINA